jgi:hypothetical protein
VHGLLRARSCGGAEIEVGVLFADVRGYRKAEPVPAFVIDVTS